MNLGFVPTKYFLPYGVSCPIVQLSIQSTLGEQIMTTAFSAQDRIVRVESSLRIMIPRRNAHAWKADTRFTIRREIGALRVLRSVV